MPLGSEGDIEYNTVGVDAAELRQYAGVRLDGGAVVIYDEDNENAWFQSDSAIGLAFVR
jgi:hypothetical protein